MISWLKQQGGNSRSRTGSPRSEERARGAPGLDWVELTGFEPVTPSLRKMRSNPCDQGKQT